MSISKASSTSFDCDEGSGDDSYFLDVLANTIKDYVRNQSDNVSNVIGWYFCSDFVSHL